MNHPVSIGLAILALALIGCSSETPPDTSTPPMTVATTLPTRQEFHSTIVAFGELAADARETRALNVPHAATIRSIEIAPGARVQRAQPLMRLATDPATYNAYLLARNAVRLATEEFARTQELYATRLASSSQLAGARQTLDDARATLAAQVAAGGDRTVTTLRAPTAGIVTSIAVQRDQYVAAGSTLLVLTPTSALVARLGVNPEDADAMHVGMPATLRVVFAAPTAPSLRATVIVVGGAVDAQSHLIPIVALLDAPTDLPIGTALSASIRGTSFAAWAIPRSALRSDAAGDFVYQIEHGTAHRVAVKVVAPEGNRTGVDGALDPQAPVITVGSNEVDSGDDVTPAVTGTSAR